MRPILMTFLVACSSPPAPTTVVVRDTLLDKVLVEHRLGGEPSRLPGCRLLEAEGAVVVRCDGWAARFDCRDHTTRPLGLLIDGVAYEFTCH